MSMSMKLSEYYTKILPWPFDTKYEFCISQKNDKMHQVLQIILNNKRKRASINWHNR